MKKTDSEMLNEIKKMIRNFRIQEKTLYEEEYVSMYQYLVYRIEQLINNN